jgi:signal transduction histidine kinase
VILGRQPDRVTVTVENEPPAGAPPDIQSGGHGMIGMRERVAVFDGTLVAGPRPDGGFIVEAGFPIAH